MVSSKFMIWLVICVLLFLRSCVLVMSVVSFKWMLTYRSFMSSVMSLCLSLIVNFTRSLARLVEFHIV
jgi:hypothetical protein